MKQKIAIVGAGAAGCFSAIEIKRRLPDAEVIVLEKGPKALAKVAVTGGGRCNLTNTFAEIGRLGEAYPRGEQLMKRALRVFSQEDTMDWFEHEGVRLVVQDDQCVFPVSQDAMQIVRTLENLMRRLGVTLSCGCRVDAIDPQGGESSGGFELKLAGGDTLRADKVLVTSGGGALGMLPPCVKVEKPVPSLFTLTIEDRGLRSLAGTLAEEATLTLAGTKIHSSGTLLITDWGVSGPATLKLSSYAARVLADNSYKGTLLINYLSAAEAEVQEWLEGMIAAEARKQLSSTPPSGITQRLWKHLLGRAGLREDIRWAELGSKGRTRLAQALTADAYPIAGRCHFKEEFVTCGGVSLKDIDINTLESRSCPGLYFAGEVLDVDAITGGFNLQAAWSMGMVAAQSICKK